jgi:hypothetical protein
VGYPIADEAVANLVLEKIAACFRIGRSIPLPVGDIGTCLRPKVRSQRTTAVTKIVPLPMHAMMIASLLLAVAQAAPPSKGVPFTSPPTGPDAAPTTTIAKNIVTDFRAKCDGVANDAPYFMSFNSWARAQTLPIMLTIPSGSVCTFRSTPATFAVGVRNLVVSGYGAKFETSLGSFYLGGYGIVENNRTSALIASVVAGATSVTLLIPSQSSRFKVGRYVLLTGGDLQGYGYPPNPWVFEYAMVTGINARTGVITLGAPLQHSYRSTWPSYQTGTTTTASLGGPATLYALHPSWDTVLEYRGLTISGSVQTYANGRAVKFTDVTFDGCRSGGGLAPTQNLRITLTNVVMLCQMEVDKLVSNFDIEGGTFDQLLFQSSSIDLLTMNNAAVATLNGTPKKAVITNSTIGTFIAGTLGFGQTTEISCTTCTIASFKNPPGGVLDVNVDSKYTMSGGIITVPNSHGPVRWAVPGTNVMFARYNGSLFTQGMLFHVIDVMQDINNTYVKTSLTGGFPSMPKDSSTGLSIYAHPAPKFTCTHCTGSADTLDLSQAPPSAPIYSYSKRTYTGNNLPFYTGQNVPIAHMWGNIVSVKINVTTPYKGAQSVLTMNALGPYGAEAIAPDGSATSCNPAINLKVAGERIISPSSLRGVRSGDSISVPGQLWLTNGVTPTISADINGEPPSVWPTVTIEITTDQGVVNPSGVD